MAVATKRDFSISYGLQTDRTGTSTGDTLVVDQVNDKVGVNQGSPGYDLDVDGDINFTGTLYKDGVEHVASRWTLTGSDIYRLSKVGINESNPQSQLAVKGYITESTDDGTTYWNVVTQQDIGTDANQVPLNQYLGKLAFLDDFSPNGLRREGGSSDDLSITSTGDATFNTTGYVKLPVGNATTDRPATAAAGMLRFNNVTNVFEGYDGTAWGTVGGGVEISETAPTVNTNPGDLWWDSTGGRLYVYYNDGTTSNWVDASPFGTTTDLVVDGTLTVRTKAMIGNDSTATNLEVKVTATQATNTNKALTINNNDQTSGLDISYRGEILPKADADVNLGGPSNRWANIYSADLQLSNEGSHNDVDGTWGKYTIQEGEEDLFLINRRSGKKYKFVLQEV